MPNSTLSPGSLMTLRSSPARHTFLFLLLAIVASQVTGCKKTTTAPPEKTARETEKRAAKEPLLTVDREAGQRVYDPAFLKALSPSASAAIPKSLPAGKRVTQVGGYEVTLDTSHQVLELAAPGVGQGQSDTPLAPSFAQLDLDSSKFAPAAALALKAKQFDDGLYAAVELASDAGLNHFPDRKHFILDLLKALETDSNLKAQAILTAAARLGGLNPPVSDAVALQANSVEKDFLGDELRSKPIGFYTWSEELEQIFQRDRMLQTELEVPTARSYATALARNNTLFKAYTTSLELMEKLTNPLAQGDLRNATAALIAGGAPIFQKPISLFPPSRAAETDLIKKLFGGGQIPEGFNLADEMIKQLRAGTLDIKPKPNSGWYDYESYALEPLAVPDKTPEAQHLQFDETYRKELASLFKAGMALTRETHIKQLEIPPAPIAPPPMFRKPQIYVTPELSVEPVATYYLRRARSYRFVREVVQKAFGQTGLAQMRRLTAAGPVNLSLDAELGLMEALFHGAYLRACDQIGMAPEHDTSLGNLAGEEAHRAILTAWTASLASDPDLGKDIRMMVPVFIDPYRGKIKVWVVLGILPESLKVSYSKEPVVTEIKGPNGKHVSSESVDIEFDGENHSLPHIATAEVYVTRLLNRTEFRKLCDEKKTYDAILKSLK